MRRHVQLLLLTTTVLLFGCDKPYSDTTEGLGLIAPNDSGVETVSYEREVKPILDNRCIACHSCYDAPCQLKLTAHEGIERGGSDQRVYQHQSLGEGALSRLFFDAQTSSEWREKNFHSVLAENPHSSPDEPPFSSLVGMIELKNSGGDAQHGDATSLPPLEDSDSWQCSTTRDEFLDFAHKYSNRGMPYALPAISSKRQKTIKNWVAQGSIDDSKYEISQDEADEIARWESILNRSSQKAKLIARYIYEHLFLASIYFGDLNQINSQLGKNDNRRFFQLVRSTTPPGEPIKVIATRRPFDDPGVEHVYYRLRLNRETVVAKTHMPYSLDQKKYDNWQGWFYQRDYEVDYLPSYDIETASNPFKTFAQLPADSRYRFMLDEANFIVKGFIKGPVCKGQAAVNVINEHFWVFFIEPDYQAGPQMEGYLNSVSNELDLPAEKKDTLNLFGAWDEFADKEQAFLEQRKKFIQNYVNKFGAFNESVIWDGEGDNPNAALTIYRHFDNATVHKGLSGQIPKTIWLIDYPLLERIHYLLVAGYDVYGNISHNLLSRIYMDFLRMEGESLFLLLLPEADRQALRKHWYRGADDRIENFLSRTDMANPLHPVIEVPGDDYSDNAKVSLKRAEQSKLRTLDKLSTFLRPSLSKRYDMSASDAYYPEQVLLFTKALQQMRYKGLDHLPEVSMMEIRDKDQSHYLTLLKHRGHLNNTSILFESLNLKLDETEISLLPGMVGPRPNAFFTLTLQQLGDFQYRLSRLESEEDYKSLFASYGVSRNAYNFWQTYDRFHDGFKQFSPVDYGVLDLNKLKQH